MDSKYHIDKKDIRSIVRNLPNGEIFWQKLQAAVYGSEIGKAKHFAGVRKFFLACHKYQIPIFIISHKTKYSAQNNENINLREAAMIWLKKNGFFSMNFAGLTYNQVYFEATRRKKISRIIQLSCTHFIDDLIEIFLDPSFPNQVNKILFSATNTNVGMPDIRVLNSWQNIYHEFFNSNKKI